MCTDGQISLPDITSTPGKVHLGLSLQAQEILISLCKDSSCYRYELITEPTSGHMFLQDRFLDNRRMDVGTLERCLVVLRVGVIRCQIRKLKVGLHRHCWLCQTHLASFLSGPGTHSTFTACDGFAKSPTNHGCVSHLCTSKWPRVWLLSAGGVGGLAWSASPQQLALWFHGAVCKLFNTVFR